MIPRSSLYVLTGCTACGKTAAALAWAARHDAEIVSCDSLLFYRGMDVGTAKPTPAERDRVPHHLVDILDVIERIDVRAYVARANESIAGIVARGRRVLVVGGSGFYLRSFFAPVTDEIAVDAAVRAGIERDLTTAGLPALVQRLEMLNPAGLAGLDVRNPRRVVRALERCLVSGRPLAELHQAFRAQAGAFAAWDVQLVEIAREPDELRARILRRVEAMLAAGLIEEVRALRARGLEQNPSAARAIGYRETLEWLAAGSEDRASLTAAIARNTWRLVRKQRTWFRTQLPSHRVIMLQGDAEPDVTSLFDPH
jgi:tRNA dimethylallyltransferase